MAAKKKRRAAKRTGKRAAKRTGKRAAKRRGKRAAKRTGKKKARAKKRPFGWMVQFRSALQTERAKASGFDDWSHLREIYKVEQHAIDHADRIRESEKGMSARAVPVFESPPRYNRKGK